METVERSVRQSVRLYLHLRRGLPLTGVAEAFRRSFGTALCMLNVKGGNLAYTLAFSISLNSFKVYCFPTGKFKKKKSKSLLKSTPVALVVGSHWTMGSPKIKPAITKYLSCIAEQLSSLHPSLAVF